VNGIGIEAMEFRRRRERLEADARGNVAFFLTTGIDLEEALALSGARRSAVILKLRRLLERERIKGAARHWSYDLNRHLALKQALDRLDPPAAGPRLRGGAKTVAAPEGAAEIRHRVGHRGRRRGA
jgi:hypothetical protein